MRKDRNAASVEINVYRTIEELEAFAADWEACYSESPAASPYCCFDWVYEYLRRRPQKGELRICVVRQKAKVIAIMPLVRQRSRTGYIQLQLLPFSMGMSQEAIITRQAEGLPIVEWILGHLLKHDRGFITCWLPRLRVSSPLLVSTAINGICPLFAVETICQDVSVVIQLPYSWKTYRSKLSTAHRKTMTRKTNNLRRAGSLQLVRLGIESVHDISAIDKLNDDALIVSCKSWQANATLGRAISNDNMIDFFKEVNRKMARRGMLDLSVLYLNNQPISFMWGIVRWPFISVIRSGFDPEYGIYSPGVVHEALVIEDSILRGGDKIDLGPEFMEHKSRWSEQADELLEVRYYPRRPIPTLVRWLKKYQRNNRGSGGCGGENAGGCRISSGV